MDKINLLTAKILLDVPHQLLTATGDIAAEILTVAASNQVTMITLAKSDSELWSSNPLNAVSQQLLNSTAIPITFI